MSTIVAVIIGVVISPFIWFVIGCPPPHLGRVHACIFRQCDRQILQGRSLVEGCTRLRNLILDRVSRDGCRRCRKNSTRSLTLKSPLTILTYNPKTWVIGFLETPP